MRLLFLFLWIGILLSAQGQQPQATSDFARGVQALNEKDYPTAHHQLSKWVQDHPKDALAYWYLGQVCENSQNKEALQCALDNYTKAIFLAPEFASPYFKRGRILLQLKRYEAAHEDFLTFARLPKGETTHITYRIPAGKSGVSGIFSEQGGIQDQLYYLLGLSQFGLGNFSQAISYLDSAIAYSKQADYLSQKALALDSLGQKSAAEAVLLEALQLDPEHLWTLEQLARLRGSSPDKLREPLDMAILSNPEDIQAWKKRGFYFLNQNNLPAAKRDFDQARLLAKDDPDIWLYLGTVASREKNWKQAEAYFSEGIRLDATYWNLWLARGQTRYQQGLLKEALADFVQLTGIDPNLATAYYHRGITQHRLGNREQACQDLKRAVQLGMEEAQAPYQQSCQH